MKNRELVEHDELSFANLYIKATIFSVTMMASRGGNTFLYAFDSPSTEFLFNTVTFTRKFYKVFCRWTLWKLSIDHKLI